MDCFTRSELLPLSRKTPVKKGNEATSQQGNEREEVEEKDDEKKKRQEVARKPVTRIENELHEIVEEEDHKSKEALGSERSGDIMISHRLLKGKRPHQVLADEPIAGRIAVCSPIPVIG